VTTLSKPSDHADLEETLRALDVLRERKANAIYYGRINRILLTAVLVLPICVFGVVVVGGIFEGKISYLPIIFGVGYAVLLFVLTRVLYPKNAKISDFFQGNFGFRRSNSEILDEQIADYEARLRILKRQKAD
jgi:hypothetical protein